MSTQRGRAATKKRRKNLCKAQTFSRLVVTNAYFNRSLFAQEPLGKLGTSSREFFHGPGLNNWDLSVQKDIRLTESKRLELRGEFFNAFNHAQFGNPTGNFLSGAFGVVTSARSQRIGQVAAKILF